MATSLLPPLGSTHTTGVTPTRVSVRPPPPGTSTQPTLDSSAADDDDEEEEEDDDEVDTWCASGAGGNMYVDGG